MQNAELSDRQKELVIEKLEFQMPKIVTSQMDERRKLVAIGGIVGICLEDLSSPYPVTEQPVRPSILPVHDDQTITTLAQYEACLNRWDFPATNKAELLDSLERSVLQMQRDERPRKEILI